MESTDIAHDGDLILIVHGSRQLRVSSVVLCNTSKVFKAMLRSDFAEAQAFRNNKGATTPVPLQLPDDDPEGTLLICTAIHLRDDLLPETVEHATILSFATLADKYGCAHALKHVAGHWLCSASTREVEYRTFNIIKAAYLLDHLKSFALITSSFPNVDDFNKTDRGLRTVDSSDPLYGFYGM